MIYCFSLQYFCIKQVQFQKHEWRLSLKWLWQCPVMWNCDFALQTSDVFADATGSAKFSKDPMGDKVCMDPKACHKVPMVFRIQDPKVFRIQDDRRKSRHILDLLN